MLSIYSLAVTAHNITLEKHQRKWKHAWQNTAMLLNDTPPKSLPASHADDYEHSFNWSQTKILGQATTRHAREFKEAWHSMDRSTINRHIDIPPSTINSNKLKTLDFHHYLRRLELTLQTFETPQQLQNPLPELPLHALLNTRDVNSLWKLFINV